MFARSISDLETDKLGGTTSESGNRQVVIPLESAT